MKKVTVTLTTDDNVDGRELVERLAYAAPTTVALAPRYASLQDIAFVSEEDLTPETAKTALSD